MLIPLIFISIRRARVARAVLAMSVGFAERHRLAILAGVFLSFGGALAVLYSQMPELADDERAHFKYPRNLEDAKQLGRLLSRYKEAHHTTVLLGVTLTYIVLQSFAIPGSIFLTILSGYLFPFPVALLLVCTCSALGAFICFLLSSMIGRRFILERFPDRVRYFQAEVAKHSENMLSYIIFLRVTPLLPNWFINITSPVLDVAASPFFWGTFLGVAPPSFLFIQAGTTLEQMTHTNVAWSWSSVALIVFFAIVSLLPVLWNKRKASQAKAKTN